MGAVVALLRRTVAVVPETITPATERPGLEALKGRQDHRALHVRNRDLVDASSDPHSTGGRELHQALDVESGGARTRGRGVYRRAVPGRGIERDAGVRTGRDANTLGEVVGDADAGDPTCSCTTEPVTVVGGVDANNCTIIDGRGHREAGVASAGEVGVALSEVLHPQLHVAWKYPGLADTYREGTRSPLGKESVCLVPIHRSSVSGRWSWPGCGRSRSRELAADLGISESCLRNWMAQADRDEGRRSDGLTTAEREELVRLRRELRVAKLEVEILKRAAAYFAQENVLPK